jgi:hypothetical protein
VRNFANITHRLNDALAVETMVQRDLARQRRALEQAESEVITLAVTQAQQKVGPLAGVAQTSPAFKDARETVLKMARSEALAPLYKAMQALELQADDASVARQQLENHWHATRTAANVYEAILQSMRK